MTTKTKASERLPFYNFNKIWSYNAYYNFVLGARGTGKTYGAKKKAIKDAINKGEQFIYLRRYKTEMTTARNTFFSDVKQDFPAHEFKIQGNEAMMKRDGQWDTIGYFVSLSKAGSQKSVSYPRVTKIIFDEFILNEGAIRYLPDEAILFNEFYSTVDRYRGQVRVLFLANSVSIMNPYFLAWDIDYDPHSDWVVSHVSKSTGRPFIVVHFHDSQVFAAKVFETPFGEFIKNTDYANYAVGNQFQDYDANLIAKKSSEADYVMTVETKAGTFSVWKNRQDNKWFVQEKLPEQQVIFTLMPNNMSESKILLYTSDKIFQSVKTAFRQGRLLFDTPVSRNAFREIFKR